MRCQFLSATSYVLVLWGCYGEKETQVQLSTMRLEKVETVSTYHHGPFLVYTWKEIEHDIRLWSYSDRTLGYKTGDTVTVFVRR